jgi:hypothetical protein
MGMVKSEKSVGRYCGVEMLTQHNSLYVMCISRYMLWRNPPENILLLTSGKAPNLPHAM